MTKIKTRDICKGTAKTFDRASVALEKTRVSLEKAKEIRNTADSDTDKDTGESTFENYATEKVIEYGERAIRDKDIVRSQKDNSLFGKYNRLKKTKSHINNIYKKITGNHENTYNTEGNKVSNRSIKNASNSSLQNSGNRSVIKTKDVALKKAKNTEKTVKNTGKTIKKTEKGIKTAKQTAKTVSKSTKITARVAKQVAKISVKVGKTVVSAATKLVEAIVAFLAEGGWAAVIVVVIALIAFIVVIFVFGFFFGDDINTEVGSSSAVPGAMYNKFFQETTDEYLKEITDTVSTYYFDTIDMTGFEPVNWRNVLSVYAALNADFSHSDGILSFENSENKSDILKVFNLMNNITYDVESEEIVEYEEVKDIYGNTYSIEKKRTLYHLKVSTDIRSCEEAAEFYGFDREQMELLEFFLSEECDELWNSVIFKQN